MGVIMKYILLISVLFLFGCDNHDSLEPKICHFCDGHIFWHKSRDGIWSDTWALQYEKHDGKYYHKWCDKLRVQSNPL